MTKKSARKTSRKKLPSRKSANGGLSAFAKGIRFASWHSKQQAETLRKNISLYQRLVLPGLRTHARALPGQAFDSFFLRESALFRRSRELFLTYSGVFESRLASSPRSLASAVLLENRIQYSPTEDELLWIATDRNERKNDEGLLRVVSYSTSLFHEQSHRILWKILPLPKDRTPSGLRRYLNFIESLVVGIDMALGDELGPRLSALGYLSGTLYDPGTYAAFADRREKRNYLHVAIRATFLALESYALPKVARQMSTWLPLWIPALPKEAALHAIQRALRLDDAFIEVTNPAWQKKHLKSFAEFLVSLGKRDRKRKRDFEISPDPENWLQPYLVIEAVFDQMGI